MLTRRQFRVWGMVFALLVVGLLAALPVLADPGVRLGPPDAPATGYATLGVPTTLPQTGARPSTPVWHTVGEIPRLQARPHHTMFELRQLEENLAAKSAASSNAPY